MPMVCPSSKAAQWFSQKSVLGAKHRGLASGPSGDLQKRFVRPCRSVRPRALGKLAPAACSPPELLFTLESVTPGVGQRY